MGCKHSKLVPEDTPPDQVEVKTVLEVSALKNPHMTANHSTTNNNQKNSSKANASTNRNKKQTSQSKAQIPPREDEDDPYTRSSRKVSKYQAKFDTRVTAKYDLKALIGRGSFSRVVRVEHRLTRQPYAIKMVDRVRGWEVCQSELNVLRRVKHAYIIQLVEVFETKDKVYMVMELATGGELFDRIIAKGSFTEKDATGVLRMVFDGLRYLHGLGIAHRDLKPENLLYYHPGHDSKILITDFGLSACRKLTAAGGADLMSTVCGTSQYIAPEVLARRPYTSQVDMWAMGIITYILLSGTMPFDDDNLPHLFRLILKAKYTFEGEPWKDVSDAAKEFIRQLLVVDPRERLSATSALGHPWLTTAATTAGNKNLHRTVSKNLLEHRSSLKSARSTKSTRSNRSGRSLRSGEHRRVVAEDLDALHNDPEVQAELSSLSSHKD